MPQLLGKDIGPIGYGLMGLTWRPNPQSDEESFKAMRASLEAGCNFWNAGEFYGTAEYNSLTLLNKYFTKYPEDAEKVVLSVKGGLKNMHPDGSVEGIKRSVDNCLALLGGKKFLDIFEPARVDKDTPFETTLKTLEEYVKVGKLGGISLSEVSAATIQKAVKTTTIVAVEVELSLWALDVLHNGIAAACAEHDIPIVAYSPIGRGLLTGQITKLEDIPEGDFRRAMPRFSKGNFAANLELVEELEKLAKQKSCTPAQLAISYVQQLSSRAGTLIIPIPGATKVERVVENSKQVSFSTEDLAEIDSILSKFPPAGERYPAALMTHCDG